jgi:hypothetical protein
MHAARSRDCCLGGDKSKSALAPLGRCFVEVDRDGLLRCGGRCFLDAKVFIALI